MKQGLDPRENMFLDSDMHDSIRLVLGEELSQQMIREAHNYKEPRNARK